MSPPNRSAARAFLDPLVRAGRVQWSGDAARPAFHAERSVPEWGWDGLRGRVVELVGVAGPSAVLTVAARLVLEAQGAGEPVAWLGRRGAQVYPPDVAAMGVDLSELVFVHADEVVELLRAAGVLVRSGAFGLVVIDPIRVGGRRERAAGAVSLGVQARLVGLAKRHDTAILWLSREQTAHGARDGGLGPFASLRAECRRRRLDDGVFECSVEVIKDKRRGERWQASFECDGAVGLR